MSQFTLAIDLDSTIFNENARYPQVGSIIEGAKEFINKLYDEGFFIIIWTCRNGNARYLGELALLEHGIKYHKINEHHPITMLQYGDDTRKIWADLYIDDRCLMGLPSWEEIYKICHHKRYLKEQSKKAIS